MHTGNFRRLQQATPDRHQERILPLINVVFLLLIFFMILGRISAPESVGLKPLQSMQEGPFPDASMAIVIRADGSTKFQGQPVAVGDIGAYIAALGPGAGQNTVQLRADARVEAVKVIALMDELRGVGIEQIELLTVAGNH